VEVGERPLRVAWARKVGRSWWRVFELERRDCEDVIVGGSRRLVSSSSFAVGSSAEGVMEEYGNRGV
jgi:hypothetical protein